jgi:hypothetical protein
MWTVKSGSWCGGRLHLLPGPPSAIVSSSGHRGEFLALRLRFRVVGLIDPLLNRYGLAVSDYAGHGGCFPLRVVQAGVVGSVTVSGLAERADHELAVEGICAELGLSYDGLRLAD